MGEEIFAIEHEIFADIMNRADHIIERGASQHFGSFLRIKVWFGNFDTGADGQLAAEQAAQAFQFFEPGFRLEKARVGFVWTDIPMLGEANFGNAEFDRPGAHGFRGIVGVFREARVHMIIELDLHNVIVK